ncbi:CIT [Mytilus coruscus]|uniref:CIT n=1 Tax=Mytilus coruscus TaxID=42192 RepID=A0A6J8BAI6_MYTCO|nr:CIT [Mytilus coruscus]
METSLVNYESSINVHVTPHFGTGIHNLMLAYQIISNVYIESDKLLSKDEMQNTYEYILKAYTEFEIADDYLSRLKSYVNDEFEKSMSKEKDLLDEISNLKVEIKKANLEISQKRYQIEDAEKVFQIAHEHFQTAERNKERAEREYRRKQIERESGVYVIPLIGGIAAFFSGLSDEIERARREKEFAWSNYRSHQYSLTRRQQEFEELRSNIERLKNTIHLKENKLRLQTTKVVDLKHFQNMINEKRETFGFYLRYVSALLKKTKVLKSESNVILSVEPLVNVFHDVVKYLKGSSQNIGLLKSEKFKTFLLVADPVRLEYRRYWHHLMLNLKVTPDLVSILLCFIIYVYVFEVRPVLLYLNEFGNQLFNAYMF